MYLEQNFIYSFFILQFFQCHFDKKSQLWLDGNDLADHLVAAERDKAIVDQSPSDIHLYPVETLC